MRFLPHWGVCLWWGCLRFPIVVICRRGALWPADFSSSKSHHPWYLSHFDLVRLHGAVLSQRETPAGRRTTCSTQRVITEVEGYFTSL